MKLFLMAALMSGAAMTGNIDWHDLRPLPAGVAGGAAAFEGDSVVYAGGTTWQNGSTRWLKDVWILDPRDRHWKPGPELPRAMAYGPFATIDGGLEIYGGTDGTGLNRTSLRLRGGKWSEVGPAHPHPLLARANAAGGSIYV